MNPSNKFVCFSANRICHHDDYHLLLKTFVDIENIKRFYPKIKVLFSRTNIIFLDIDSRDLIFLPFVVLRSLWGGRGVAISVRTEALLINESKSFIFSKANLKSLIKRSLFKIIKHYSKTSILSIHRNTPIENKLIPYVNEFIFDPQLWDLKYLKIAKRKPKELSDSFFKEPQKIIFIPGHLNDRRSKDELMRFVKSSNQFKFLFAGHIEKLEEKTLSKKTNCTVINRFVSNEELLYLYEMSEIIYVFYTNNRPSGFFGRALQLGKTIIVRKNAFLNFQFQNYNKLVAIENLKELETFQIGTICSIQRPNYNDFDSSPRIKILLDNLLVEK